MADRLNDRAATPATALAPAPVPSAATNPASAPLPARSHAEAAPREEAVRLLRDAARAERDLARALAREARAHARAKDRPSALSFWRERLAMDAASRAEQRQLQTAAAAASAAREYGPLPIVEELNPPETPRSRRFHRAFYAAVVPILRVVVKLTYGGKVVWDGVAAGLGGVGPSAAIPFAAGPSKPQRSLTDGSPSRLSVASIRRGPAQAPRGIADAASAPSSPEAAKGAHGAIVVINHCCYLDSVMAALALWPSRLRFLALAENGYGHMWGPLVRALGSIFVGRTLAESRQMLERQAEALAAGDCLAIYPEGNLRPYERELQPFQRGAFQIAVAHRAPVVPVTLVQAPGRGLLKRLLFKPGFEVHVGEPIACPEGMSHRKAALYLEGEARRVMEATLAAGPVVKTATQRLAARIFPA